MVIPKIPINNAQGGVASTANAAIATRNNKINYGSNTTDNWNSPTSKGAESGTAQNKTIESCDDEDFF